jgi:hypothetical protein
MSLVQVGDARSRTGRRRVRSLAIVLSVAAILATTGQAVASSPHRAPVDVNVVGCDADVGDGDGVAEVPSGTKFNITWDWETYTIWQEATFLLSAKVDAAIDGKPIAMPLRYWTRPFYLAGEEWPWRMFWKFPHRALKAGQSIIFTVTPNLRFPVYDGTDWYERGPLVTLTCEIIGV